MSRRPTRRLPELLAAGPAWRAVAPADRARLMRRFAAKVEEHAEELAQLETANVGKPITESRDEVGMVAEVLYFYAGAVDKHRGATVPVAGGRGHDVPRAARGGGGHRPVELPHRHHLVEGGTGAGHRQHHRGQAGRDHAADRPSGWPSWPSTPACPRACSRWWWGRARWSAPAWSSTPTWPRWPSPGRPRSGREVMARASGTIKRVTLELGGKSASVVFADADLERRRGRHAGRGVRQRRPGLLRPQPGAGRSGRSSTGTSSCWPTRSGMDGRGPDRPGHRRWARW